MIKRKKWVALLIIVMLVTSLFACSKAKTKDENVPFEEFLSQIFIDEVTSDTISLHYTIAHPENYGITENIETLGNYSTQQMKSDLIEAENNLETLNKYNYDNLSEEEQLIYNILSHTLSNTLKLGDYLYYQETLGPTTGLQAQLPILLAEYTFYDEEDIKTYLEILKCVKDYFLEIVTFEREKSAAGFFMTDEVADLIIAQCKDFISSPEENYLIDVFDEKVENMTELTKDEITLYQEQNRDLILDTVIPAYQVLIDALTELKGTATNTNGLCGFEKGKEYYEIMAQINTGSSKTVREMEDMLNTALNTCRVTMTTLALSNSNIYNEYSNLKFPSSDPTEIIVYLKDVIKEDFPHLEEVNCNIKYVHESLQDHLSPAMYLIPPIDDYTENNIYINNNPDYDMDMIFPTIAHEGYPGHLYQNVYFRQQNPNPVRNIINVTGYDEGWATYVELYSYDFADFSKDLSDFLKANTLALHCLYSLTDIGIHYNGWSKSDTVKFWKSFGIDSATAEEVYITMLSEPGIYLPYSIGCLELMELRNTAKEQLGEAFIIKEFHEFLLDMGPTPFAIIDNYMKEWILQE